MNCWLCETNEAMTLFMPRNFTAGLISKSVEGDSPPYLPMCAACSHFINDIPIESYAQMLRAAIQEQLFYANEPTGKEHANTCEL